MHVWGNKEHIKKVYSFWVVVIFISDFVQTISLLQGSPQFEWWAALKQNLSDILHVQNIGTNPMLSLWDVYKKSIYIGIVEENTLELYKSTDKTSR